MNERIKQLVEQARVQDRGYFIYQYGGPTGHQSVEKAIDLEKFAELIVKECAKFLDENSGYDDSNNAWHPEPEDLLKHFGVEL